MHWTLEKMHPLDKSHHVCCQEEEVEDWEVERDQEMEKRVEGNEVEWEEEMDEGSLELDCSGHRLWKMLCHL